MQILFKRIPGGRGQSHRTRALKVASYMSNTQNEKCILLQGFNFRGADPKDPQAMAREMADIAMIHDPESRFFCLAHYTLSLKPGPGEGKPEPETLVKAARHAMLEMGATAGTPYMVAVHGDRDHPHCHIFVSRVDRDEWRIVDDRSALDGEFLGGWKSHLQYTAASVAQAFGWEVPEGSRYAPSGKTQKITLEDHETGLAYEWERPVPVRVKSRRSILEPPGAAVLEEQRTGLVSRERRIQERTREIDLSQVADFPSLHRRLAEVGLTVEKVERENRAKGRKDKGFGLIFTDGVRRVKGSHIGADWSCAALENALGAYVPPTQDDVDKARSVQEAPRLTQEAMQALKKQGISAAQVKAISDLPASLVKGVKSARPQHTALGMLASKYGAVGAVKALIRKYPHALEAVRKEERRREILFRRSVERSRKRFWKGVRDARYIQNGSDLAADQAGRNANAGADLSGGKRGRL